MAELAMPTLALLALVGLIGGVGISAIGPGGVLITIGLFTLTPLSPSAVAGTAIVTHIGTGLISTVAFTRSGQLLDPPTRRVALLLCLAAVIATPLGVMINASVSGRAFGLLLGAFVALVAALVLYREFAKDAGVERATLHHSTSKLMAVGLVVAVVSGMFGVGGPMLATPLLLIIGLPLLQALAAAQVQSIVIATVGSIGYLSQGDIHWPLAFVVGAPEVIGVVIGWRLANAVETRYLKYALVAALLALAPYLAFQS